MFDRHEYRHESKVVAITKEIEKTISPDKVTEMYDAIREEVGNNIVERLVLRGNDMEGAVVVFIEPDRFSTMFRGHFKLNGKEYTFGFRQNEAEIMSKEQLAKLLYQQIAEEITKELMRGMKL